MILKTNFPKIAAKVRKFPKSLLHILIFITNFVFGRSAELFCLASGRGAQERVVGRPVVGLENLKQLYLMMRKWAVWCLVAALLGMMGCDEKGTETTPTWDSTLLFGEWKLVAAFDDEDDTWEYASPDESRELIWIEFRADGTGRMGESFDYGGMDADFWEAGLTYGFEEDRLWVEADVPEESTEWTIRKLTAEDLEVEEAYRENGVEYTDVLCWQRRR